MADAGALRDSVVRRARERFGRYNPNDLHTRISSYFREMHEMEPPVGRSTFYEWFDLRKPARQAMLEYIPAFAAVLAVDEYELWLDAKVLPPQMEMSLSLAMVAHDLRDAYRKMRKSLAQGGLSTAGEALIVDRILHHKLDYRMVVTPIVRGTTKQLHLHSLISLEPVPSDESTTRLRTSTYERLPIEDRRRHIREDVITEGTWRALGLKWRNRPPLPSESSEEETPSTRRPALYIEVPVEERARAAPPEPARGTRVERILILGSPWAHAELMAALLADALRFGSWDLRYIGYHPERSVETKADFCRTKLAQAAPRYVWAIAQRYDVMETLRPDIVRAAPGTLVVTVTYGSEMEAFAAQVLRTRDTDIGRAQLEIRSTARELAPLTDVLHVEIADEDLELTGNGGKPVEERVRDLAVDVARGVTAQILSALQARNLGPPPSLWGDRFEDMRHGRDADLVLPEFASTVRWLEPR